MGSNVKLNNGDGTTGLPTSSWLPCREVVVKPAFTVFQSFLGKKTENTVFSLSTGLMSVTESHLQILSCLVIVAGYTSSYLPRQENEFEISSPVSKAKCSITELSEKMSGTTSLSLSSKLI